MDKPAEELSVMEVITSAMDSFRDDEPQKIVMMFSTKGFITSYSNCSYHERVGFLVYSLACAIRAWFKED